MKFTRIVLVGAVFAFGAQETSAQRIIKRICTTDAWGTRTCIEYFQDGKAREPRTDRIMGMPAKQYERGVRDGKCMPSPSGACGGG